jgi:hypothetical protein
MGLFNFFTPKNRRFDYTPRYYDKRKERLEAIKKKYDNPDRALIEERIRGRFQRHTRRENIFMKTSIRFIIILAVLLGITYLLFKYLDIPLF